MLFYYQDFKNIYFSLITIKCSLLQRKFLLFRFYETQIAFFILHFHELILLLAQILILDYLQNDLIFLVHLFKKHKFKNRMPSEGLRIQN